MIGQYDIGGRWRAAAGILLLIFVAACAAGPERSLDNINDLESLRRTALSLVNEERAREGLPSLRMSAPLNAAAQAHAEDMARRNFYAHRSPERRGVGDRYRASGGGLWNIIAENITRCIACRSPAEQLHEFHAGWMRSSGHRRNILDPRVRSFGFGIASAEGRLYAVQTFVGERGEAVSQTIPPPVPVIAGRSAAAFAR
ncbi:CAP domain-containing protein [Chelativorans salis]|uniref:CAP domain-containing protein n=1 Tax=Chelativorans salis TaxID=2978478 RepID=A0ABT2LTT5_9HYPH|nr:CAP domain-containing protein [Chelativorans sp. EGI FJ00035]MCT7377023.1 CAP domain-containing protein [Chelativorans sp. EGI FJ00035]